MAATLPLFILLLLVHVGIFVTSPHPDRFRRLLMALAVIIVSVPLLWLGMAVTEPGLMRALARHSPLMLAVLAFLVYLRRSRG